MKKNSHLIGALLLITVSTVWAEPSKKSQQLTSSYPIFEQEEDSYAMGIKNAMLILRTADNPFDYLGYVVEPNQLAGFFKPIQVYADGVLYRIAGELVFVTKREGFPFRRDLLFNGQYAYQLIHIKVDRNLYDQLTKLYVFQPLMIYQ